MQGRIAAKALAARRPSTAVWWAKKPLAHDVCQFNLPAAQGSARAAKAWQVRRQVLGAASWMPLPVVFRGRGSRPRTMRMVCFHRCSSLFSVLQQHRH